MNDGHVLIIAKNDAEKIKLLEQLVIDTGMALLQRGKGVFQFKTDDNRFFTKAYNLYCHPQAKGLIERNDTFTLMEFAWIDIKFIYDYRLDNPTGEIKIRSTGLYRLESNLWYCNKSHAKVERILPPLRDNYVLHCSACNKPMKIGLPALLPNFRQRIESLQER